MWSFTKHTIILCNSGYCGGQKQNHLCKQLKNSWKEGPPKTIKHMMWICSVAQGFTKWQNSRSRSLLVGEDPLEKSIYLLYSFFRCFLVVAVRDRMLRQTHLCPSPEQLFLYSHKDLGGIPAKMGLCLQEAHLCLWSGRKKVVSTQTKSYQSSPTIWHDRKKLGCYSVLLPSLISFFNNLPSPLQVHMIVCSQQG